MTCIVDQTPPHARPFRKESFWRRLSLVFSRAERTRIPRLNPCELSDHLKRDLGFLDGRGCC